ncbi:FecR domain-containing protein [Delftia acidovorans]|uniref:FecR domain-containing protein n=2 Tax=Delftia acidovorans TaxID=80866 RepID=A0A7T2S9H8_DELAC|nr:FecR domain-containing protein [Delftia acidovorans]
MPGAGPDDDALAEQAAQWLVALTGDDEAECATARAGFEAWKRADPRHAAAALDMGQFLDRLQVARSGPAGSRPARAALDASGSAGRKQDGQTRRARRTRRAGAALMLAAVLAVLAVLALPAWVALQAWPPGYLMADLRTATGQWQTRVLADGTRITLASGSAVNLRYDERRRTVELVQGEILVDVARDASRPFVVETAQGSLRALGTRFVVDRQADATVLSVLESRVAAQAAAGGQDSATVDAGQRVRITDHSLGPVQAMDARGLADAWRQHQLVVSDQPLAEVLDALARHRPGHIRYDSAQIHHLRVSAVLPLDDTDRALQLLMSSFPELRIRTLTPWLVLVDAP